MSKLIKILLLLLILGTVGLIFGLIDVPRGRICYLDSSLFGLESTPLHPDGFNWRWKRLIPWSTRLYYYPAAASSYAREVKVLLPPGQLPGLPRESELHATVAVRLRVLFNAENTLKLAQAGIPDEAAFYATLNSSIDTTVQAALASEADRAITENRLPLLIETLESMRENILEPDIQARLDRYGIELEELVVAATLLPDSQHYERVIRLAADSYPQLSRLVQSRLTHLLMEEEMTLSREQELKQLEAVGALITKYPLLLQYLAVNKLSDKVQLILLNAGSSETLNTDMYRKISEDLVESLKQQPAARSTTNQ